MEKATKREKHQHSQLAGRKELIANIMNKYGIERAGNWNKSQAYERH